MATAAARNQASTRWYFFGVVTLCFQNIEVIAALGMTALVTMQALIVDNADVEQGLVLNEFDGTPAIVLDATEQIDGVVVDETDAEQGLDVEDIDGGACDT